MDLPRSIPLLLALSLSATACTGIAGLDEFTIIGEAGAGGAVTAGGSGGTTSEGGAAGAGASAGAAGATAAGGAGGASPSGGSGG